MSGITAPTADIQPVGTVLALNGLPTTQVGGYPAVARLTQDLPGTLAGIYTLNQNDLAAYSRYIVAGTWACVMGRSQNTDQGIADLQLDGVSFGTVDAYGATGVGFLVAAASMVVATSGVHVVRYIVSTKNVLSSSYQFLCFGLWLTRTA